MDKNTITGLVLIGVVLVVFSYLGRPTEEQTAAMQRYNDSIALVQKEEAKVKAKTQAALANERHAVLNDSTAMFYSQSKGTEQTTTIENDVMKLSFSNKGGRVSSVMLKDYNDQEKKPLVLFKKDESSMNFYFYDGIQKKAIQSKDLYFNAVNQTDSSVTFRISAAEGKYIDFIYKLKPKSYLVDFDIKATGMSDLLASTNYLNVEWQQRAHLIERDHTYEGRYSNITYKVAGDDTDNLSSASSKELKPEGKLDWIAYKNQFFSSVLIANQDFEEVTLNQKKEEKTSKYLKDYSSEMKTAFDPTGVKATSMHLYFGPNHFKTLKALDKERVEKWDMYRLVDLGWPVVRWVNRLFTINVFYWLSKLGLSMGVILLIMTILIKIVIFPATYKSYMSSAKMKVLKPKVEEINKKYPNKEDAMKKQQETMGLYSQYGVSPMGGCLPMLLQFPILMAMFMFVPTAIELRQQSFLWADDLSNYDAFINFGFNIPFLGDHLSLFCVLMTVTTLLNTKFTMAQQDTGQNQQMPAMKWMMYIMPVMFLFILNGYPAGLNYYYFISTLISVITMIVLRRTTDDNKLLAQLEANKVKNAGKKKSGFSARLQAMQEQQRMMQEQQNKNKK